MSRDHVKKRRTDHIVDLGDVLKVDGQECAKILAEGMEREECLLVAMALELAMHFGCDGVLHYRPITDRVH